VINITNAGFLFSALKSFGWRRHLIGAGAPLEACATDAAAIQSILIYFLT
jgi:hypothetical protein